jgi:hypothetical protein
MYCLLSSIWINVATRIAFHLHVGHKTSFIRRLYMINFTYSFIWWFMNAVMLNKPKLSHTLLCWPLLEALSYDCPSMLTQSVANILK